jgi:hypothetical protein
MLDRQCHQILTNDAAGRLLRNLDFLDMARSGNYSDLEGKFEQICQYSSDELDICLQTADEAEQLEQLPILIQIATDAGHNDLAQTLSDHLAEIEASYAENMER